MTKNINTPINCESECLISYRFNRTGDSTMRSHELRLHVPLRGYIQYGRYFSCQTGQFYFPVSCVPSFKTTSLSNIHFVCVFLQDKKEAQHQISVLLFIGLVCGLMMLLLTRLFGPWAVTGKPFFTTKINLIHLKVMYLNFFFAAFTRGKNIEIVPAANTYVQVLFFCLFILSYSLFQIPAK